MLVEEIRKYGKDIDQYFDHVDGIARMIEIREDRLRTRLKRLNRLWAELVDDLAKFNRHFVAHRTQLTT